MNYIESCGPIIIVDVINMHHYTLGQTKCIKIIPLNKVTYFDYFYVMGKKINTLCWNVKMIACSSTPLPSSVSKSHRNSLSQCRMTRHWKVQSDMFEEDSHSSQAEVEKLTYKLIQQYISLKTTTMIFVISDYNFRICRPKLHKESLGMTNWHTFDWLTEHFYINFILTYLILLHIKL